MENQTTVKDKQIDKQVKDSAVGDLVRHIGAILLALSAFLGIIGFNFDWLHPESINAFVVVLYAIAGFGYTAFEIYKNKFASKKGKQQNKELKDKGLKK